MSGRVVDLDVNPNDPTEFYVAYASGGLWHTRNNGTTFRPVMDNAETQNVGDIVVDWVNGTIWVGTGENNASRSSYSGIGVLKSDDGGESWINTGLQDSHHIGRILLNPNDPNEVVVGVTGHLYTSNEERGVYKSNDGGKTWKRTLFINDSTGIIDLVHVPGNFDIQYAAAWDKDRKAWNFRGSGPGSGIYKSTDGGNSWKEISKEGSGLPKGEGLGRIGLAVFDANTIYAVIDNQDRRMEDIKEPMPSSEIDKSVFKDMSTADFMAIQNTELEQFLRSNDFPDKYTAESVKKLVEKGEIQPDTLFSYLQDANSQLISSPVIGAEVYRSTDGGMKWEKMNETYIDDLYYTYGYYFALIRVDPTDSNRIYIGGVPILKSDDGGKTFQDISGENVHADHHALWLNPKRSGHLVNGNDGGVNISYDYGASWIKNNSPEVGQFYAINVDYQDPYNVYGGLQDNGVWMGPHNGEESTAWHQSGQYHWRSIMGGDGMQVQIDRSDPNTVYTGFQFGNYYRLDLEARTREKIQPTHDLGEARFRFNWQTPILISPHNQDILYMGSNHLHRSMNQGMDWEMLSGDLSKGGQQGNVANGTLTTISESPFSFGHLYVGTDDGSVHLTEDGGSNWKNISGALPEDLWISEVLASQHNPNRVYVCLNGYRNDHFEAYIYMSEDRGTNWTKISSSLPSSPVNALAEDPYNELLLFTGTDNGLFVTFNGGQSWERFQNGLPRVAVHDLVIQSEARHLLVGTHGRSIYKADISTLEKLTPEVLEQELMVFDVPDVEFDKSWGNPAGAWDKPSTPGLDIPVYSREGQQLSLEVSTLDGVTVSSATLNADKGLNLISYDMAFSKKGLQQYLKKYKRKLIPSENGKTYLPTGGYNIVVKGTSAEQKTAFSVIEKNTKSQPELLIHGIDSKYSRLTLSSNLIEYAGLQCPLPGNCGTDTSITPTIQGNPIQKSRPAGKATSKTTGYSQEYAGSCYRELSSKRYYHVPHICGITPLGGPGFRW